MNAKKNKPASIAQEDWDAVDSPELPEGMLEKMRPAAETHPEIVEAYRQGQLRRRGPQKVPTKILVSIRYSEEVLTYFRATGPHWQTRMDEALKAWIQDHPGAAGCPSK